MARHSLGRLLWALPLRKLSRECCSCTKLAALTECHLEVRSGNQVAPLTTYALSMRVRRYSTFLDSHNSHLEQAASKLVPHNIVFSAGQPPDLPERAANLMSTWELSSSNKGITRHYTFSSFSKAWQFMSVVADECKLKKHHPSWSNLYNKVTIEWTTHKPEGLSIRDVEMAEFCDQAANEIGLKA